MSGAAPPGARLCAGAIRLAREVYRSRPDDADVVALLKLMSLTEAPIVTDAGWLQIVVLHEQLHYALPSPAVNLNRAVAVAMVNGPRAGLGLLQGLAAHKRLADHHRLAATQAQLQEMAGDLGAALASYLEAAACATSRPERRYLESRAAWLMVPRQSADIRVMV